MKSGEFPNVSVKCDAENNPPSVRQAGALRVDVVINHDPHDNEIVSIEKNNGKWIVVGWGESDDTQ